MNLLNLKQEHTSKKLVFQLDKLVKSLKIEAMVTSLIEMLELPSFDHMITSTIYFESREKLLLMTSWTEIMIS